MTPTATIETKLEHAALVARAVTPDNTPEMTTDYDDGVVETTIERDTTGGLRATATDYIANLDVAGDVVQVIDRQTTHQS